MEQIRYFSKCFLMQGKLDPKLTLGPFYTIHLLKMAKTNFWERNVNFKLIIDYSLCTSKPYPCLQFVWKWKIWHCHKNSQGFNIKRHPFSFLITENSFELRIVVLVMLNKMLLMILTIDFYSCYGMGS